MPADPATSEGGGEDSRPGPACLREQGSRSLICSARGDSELACGPRRDGKRAGCTCFLAIVLWLERKRGQGSAVPSAVSTSLLPPTCPAAWGRFQAPLSLPGSVLGPLPLSR